MPACTSHRLTLIVILLTLLAGCAAMPGADALPTPWPENYLPTVVALTAAAIAPSIMPTLSPTETPTTAPQPSPSPAATFDVAVYLSATPTLAFSPTPEPARSTIEIVSPGPMSKVVSPLHLRAYVLPGARGQVQVDLQGEDGRLLARNILRPDTRYGGKYYISLELRFEIRAAAEVGRLQISALDEYGRLKAVGSTHLLLLSAGNSEITPPGNDRDRLILYEPLPGVPIFGGVFAVRGEMQPFNEQPVFIELHTRTSEVIGIRVLSFPAADLQPFATTVPYQIYEPTWVRLVIRQDDDRIPGIMYLYSHEVLLNP